MPSHTHVYKSQINKYYVWGNIGTKIKNAFTYTINTSILINNKYPGEVFIVQVICVLGYDLNIYVFKDWIHLFTYYLFTATTEVTVFRDE